MKASLRERLSWGWADLRYHTQSWFHLTLAITSWTCHHKLHRFEYDPESGRSWSEPGGPGWDCVYCGRGGYPYRYAIADWAWGHAPLRWITEWRIERNWQRAIKNGEVQTW